MEIEPIEFGVGELSLERLGIKVPSEMFVGSKTESPDVEAPIEEPDMASPIEPQQSFEAEVVNDRFKYAAEGFLNDLTNFVSKNYMILGTLTLIGYMGYRLGWHHCSDRFSAEEYY